ncbi:hypothetical protein LTR97_003926 [Elasticomyces elasticus]|uniref:F-box domain-containing protein n=1 Tax=Elasticomyces elasticus TaxID=574655 RepID=A0AAN8A3X8_9PEZI|nr:hypothetical protein LTR97_003926 [Elasticomyces elasticus]
MLMTQPPCSGVTLSGIAPRTGTGLKETLQANSGIRLGEFMARATVVAFYHSENAEAITGHEEWRSIGRSIDEMTGWEMLQLLKMSPDVVLDPRTVIPAADKVSGTLPAALSAAKVLGTYELLEVILLHLPLRQLLLCQRVNRAFKAVIDRSASIRKALFLDPPAATQSIHGIYRSTFAPRKEGAGSLTIEINLPGTSKLGSTVSSTLDRFQCRFGLVNGVLRWSASQVPQDSLASQEKSLNWHESLQRMLVTHPPVRKLTLSRVNAKPLSSSFYDAQISPLNNKIWQQKLNQTRDPTDVDGVRFKDFIKATTTIAALVKGKESTSDIRIVGGESIRLCPKSVDKMTGWEMLRFFEVGEGRFRAEQGMDESDRNV